MTVELGAAPHHAATSRSGMDRARGHEQRRKRKGYTLTPLVDDIRSSIDHSETLVDEGVADGSLKATDVIQIAFNLRNDLHELVQYRSRSEAGKVRHHSWLDIASGPESQYLANCLKQLPTILRNLKNNTASADDVKNWYSRVLSSRDEILHHLADHHLEQLDRQDQEELRDSLRYLKLNDAMRREEQQSRERLARDITVAQEGAQAVEQTVVSVREAAGVVGDESLGTYYQKVAASEGRSATIWRAVGLALSAGLTALAFFGLATADLADAVDVTRRTIAGLPLAGVTGYVLREAGHHRRTAGRYKLAEVQLRSLNAFVEPLPDTERISVRVALSSRVFGHLDSAQSEGRTQLPPLDLSLLDKLRSQIPFKGNGP